MHKSKLLRYLKTLHPDELRRFDQFIRSPFYNTNKKVIRLWQYISRYTPELRSPRLSKTNVWKQLFPGENYDDNRLRQLIHLACKLLESFLAVLELEAEPQSRQLLLTNALARRELYASFSKTATAQIKKLESLPLANAESCWQLHDYHQQLYFHPDTPKFKQGGQGLQSCIDSLDRFYLLKKLEYGCETANRTLLFSEQYDDQMLEHILDLYDQKSLSSENAIASLYRDFIALQSSVEDLFLFVKIKTLFFDIAGALSQQERISIHQYLNNYAARQVNTGNRGYYQEMFELARMAVEYDLYIKNGRITYAAFTNIAVMGSVLQEFTWVRQFINDNQSLLEPREQEAALSVSMAYWHYHQQNYREVLDCLRAIQSLPAYGFRVKSLRMRTFYELSMEDVSYQDSLRLEMTSFEQYIRREKKIAADRKESYLNQISLLKKLIRLKNDPNRSQKMVADLKTEIEKKQPLFAKPWLLEKLEALLASR